MSHSVNQQQQQLSMDPKVMAFHLDYLEVLLGFKLLDKDAYKDLKPAEKEQIDKVWDVACTGFLTTPEYKSGNTQEEMYKVCCEVVDYCSFYKQPWFMLVAVAGGLILLNIISVGLLTCFFCCKKKGPPGGSSSVPKTPKTEKTGKSKKSGK